MNLQFYLEKLHSSKEFKQFKEENPKAYFCSSFFIIDKEGKDDQTHLDYFNPKNKGMISFSLNGEVEGKSVENHDSSWLPKKLNESINFDFEEVEKIIAKRIEEENIKNKVQKILISLQKSDQEDSLLCTVFISMMGMLKVRINLSDMKINEFEKKSFMDILKVRRK